MMNVKQGTHLQHTHDTNCRKVDSKVKAAYTVEITSCITEMQDFIEGLILAKETAHNFFELNLRINNFEIRFYTLEKETQSKQFQCPKYCLFTGIRLI